MEILGRKKLNTRIPISFEKARRYMEDERYKGYNFPAIFDEKGRLIGYKPELKKTEETYIKKQSKFMEYVKAGGRYKNIEVNNIKKYGNYQNTKGYRKSKGLER